MKTLKHDSLAIALFFLSACSAGSCDSMYPRDKCGKEGQPACAFHGPKSGGPCDEGLASHDGRCVKDCGDVGERCCNTTLGTRHCGEKNHCNEAKNECEAGPPLCTPGPNPHVFSCVNDDGCGAKIVQSLVTADRESARECLKQQFGCASLSDEPLEPYCYQYKNEFVADNKVGFEALSEDDAERCAPTLARGDKATDFTKLPAGSCL